ncbi:MAG: diaminopimelate decarboxylase [Pseudomonadota bacterium]
MTAPAETNLALDYRHGALHFSGVALSAIAAAVGTPCYVYSRPLIEARYRELAEAFEGVDHQLCYAVKANSNLSVLAVLAELGAGFDIVSAGELERVIAAGGDPAKVVFSGVGKGIEEIDLALKYGIACFNVESASELARIEARAQLHGRRAPISLRINPDVDAMTHPYISTGLKSNKFGIPAEQAVALYRSASESEHLQLVGADCHIGSQIADTGPMLEALDSLLALVDALAREGIAISHLDLGGGFGVRYQSEQPFPVADYGAAVRQSLGRRALKVLLEPGRYIVADAGVLLTRVEYLKPAADKQGHDFAIIDGAMNDLLRPALYQAWHQVSTVAEHPPAEADARAGHWDIVGPVCESGDFLARERDLTLWEGALLAVHSAGAYGMVLSSNYNSRNRCAEVLIEQNGFRVVRRRETLRDQLACERDGLAAPLRAVS